MEYKELIKKQYLLFHDDVEFIENDFIIDFLQNENIMVYTKIENLMDICFDDPPPHSLEDILWKYNEENLRIPHINGVSLLYYRLNESSANIYDFISSNKILSMEQIISGERLQGIADVTIGTHSSLRFNPNMLSYTKKVEVLDEINSLDAYKTIFVYTHDISHFIGKFKNEICDKILITHNSDDGIHNIVQSKAHFSQNVCIAPPKAARTLVPLPIGIENTQWFDYHLFEKVKNMKIKKTKHIYFFFSLDTHPSRKDCFHKLNGILEWNVKKNKEEYFMELAAHKYAICPRGNGLDTHRFWECLYLDVIPIIIEPDDLHIDGLPFIRLKNWEEVFDKLTDSFSAQKMSKITLSYYKNLIEGAATGGAKEII